MDLFDALEPERVEPRTWYRFEGQEVEVMGTSPLMVWFRRQGESQLAQRTILLAEFQPRATFLRRSAL